MHANQSVLSFRFIVVYQYYLTVSCHNKLTTKLNIRAGHQYRLHQTFAKEKKTVLISNRPGDRDGDVDAPTTNDEDAGCLLIRTCFIQLSSHPFFNLHAYVYVRPYIAIR